MTDRPTSLPAATRPAAARDDGPSFSIAAPKLELPKGGGVFGFGWSLAQPHITRRTDKGLPRYDDAAASEVFLLSAAEDLVPMLQADGSRFEDPADARLVFSWLLCETRDNKGNAIVYGYQSEDVTGVDLLQPQERNRGPQGSSLGGGANPEQAKAQTQSRRDRIAASEARAQTLAGKRDAQEAGAVRRGRKLSDSGAKARFFHEVSEARLAHIIGVDLKSELFTYDIERNFRLLKSEIESAPVFHRLPERLRAHASICFMAVVLRRVMRQRLKNAGSTHSYAIYSCLKPISDSIFRSRSNWAFA